MNDCAAPRHDEPEPAAPHSWLCRPCTSGLRRDLHRLPAWWALIEEHLEPGAANGFGGGENSIGLPVNENAVRWRWRVRCNLEWWTAEISRQSRAEKPSDARIAALAGWLHGQVQWASFRDWAGDMAGAFAGLASDAYRIIDPRPPTESIIPAWGNACTECHATGSLYVRRRQSVTCGGCGYEWNSTQLMRLGRDIIRALEAA